MAVRDPRDATRISKTLSFWLRHNPEAGGLKLDAEGWADAAAVVTALSSALERLVTFAELEAVVRGSDKQRFVLDHGRIRAQQGHSLAHDLTFAPVTPPALLHHGTTQERWQQIRATGGLEKMQRHHVHLSLDEATASRVASRHRGERPLVLTIDAATMVPDGYPFFRSENGVYLTERVPLRHIGVVAAIGRTGKRERR